MVTTKKQIAAADVGWHPDPRCQGFALWVKPNGARRWVLDYRFHGRQRRITIGGGELPASEALKLARRHRVAIDHGRDPLAEKAAARRATEAAVTLSVFFDRYIDEHATVKKKPRSIAEDKRLYAYTIRDRLGRVRVPDLTDEDVRRLHRSLKATPVTANRMLALVSKMMNLAEAWKVRPPYSNPCRHVPRYPEQKRHRFLTAEQLQALGKALAESDEPPMMVHAVRLILFTGCRRGEVLGLTWDAVDLERGLLHLSDSKTGPKTIVLNAPARQVLAELAKQRTDGSPWVLPGRFSDRPLALPKAWERIRATAGLPDVRLHDLRHTFGSTGAGLGQGLPVLGALMGHTVAQTTARYAGVAADPRREAAERIGERLASLLSPPETKAAVVPMRKRRRRG